MSPNSSEILLKTHAEINDMLQESLALVKSAETNESFLAYREVVMDLMEVTLTQVINPLCRQHPHLKPESLFIPEEYMSRKDNSGL